MFFKAEVERAKVKAEMKRLHEQMDVLKRSGLDKEEKRLLPKYNSLVMQVKELGEQIEADRRRSAQAFTEYNANVAWNINFSNAYLYYSNVKADYFRCRPVAAFEL